MIQATVHWDPHPTLWLKCHRRPLRPVLRQRAQLAAKEMFRGERCMHACRSERSTQFFFTVSDKLHMRARTVCSLRALALIVMGSITGGRRVNKNFSTPPAPSTQHLAKSAIVAMHSGCGNNACAPIAEGDTVEKVERNSACYKQHRNNNDHGSSHNSNKNRFNRAHSRATAATPNAPRTSATAMTVHTTTAANNSPGKQFQQRRIEASTAATTLANSMGSATPYG